MTEKTVCNVHRAVELIGSKWTLLVLHNLCSSKKGFNELQRALDGISPRILSLRLKEMVEHGLITKTIFPTTPPQVEYALTPKGESLKSIITQLGDWADTVHAR